MRDTQAIGLAIVIALSTWLLITLIDTYATHEGNVIKCMTMKSKYNEPFTGEYRQSAIDGILYCKHPMQGNSHRKWRRTEEVYNDE